MRIFNYVIYNKNSHCVTLIKINYPIEQQQQQTNNVLKIKGWNWCLRWSPLGGCMSYIVCKRTPMPPTFLCQIWKLLGIRVLQLSRNYRAGIYLLKVNNKNTRTRCEICSKLTIKTPERRHWCRSGVFIVIFEHIRLLVLVFLLLTLGVVLVSLLLLWTYFTLCFDVSITNFEHVIAGWVALKC